MVMMMFLKLMMMITMMIMMMKPIEKIHLVLAGDALAGITPELLDSKSLHIVRFIFDDK